MYIGKCKSNLKPSLAVPDTSLFSSVVGLQKLILPPCVTAMKGEPNIQSAVGQHIVTPFGSLNASSEITTERKWSTKNVPKTEIILHSFSFAGGLCYTGFPSSVWEANILSGKPCPQITNKLFTSFLSL